MKKLKTLALAAATLALAACTTPPAPPGTAAEPWVANARQVATAVPPKLLNVLLGEMAKSGPEGAVETCRDQAPALARQASAESGWSVRRVSLKNRNPKAQPDAWERAALQDFDRRAAAGAAPASLERAELVRGADGQAELRYMRALPVIELCTQCHGTPEKISPAVAAKLKVLYPQDQGVGYQVGEIRGAMTLRKPAP